MRSLILCGFAHSAVLFAAAAEGAGGKVAGKTDTPPAAAIAAATDAKTGKRVIPDLTPVRNDVPMPTVKSRRGSTSSYNFAGLEVGQSFGIKNKTAADLSSIVSAAMRKFSVPKINADGSKVFKTKKITAADGTKNEVPTAEPVLVKTREFFAHDVEDPKADPDGATVRVFRSK